MTGRRKLTAIDDPLVEAPSQARPVMRPRRQETAALYVELPVAQADALARAAFELRTHKRRIVAALIAEHVDATSVDGRHALAELLTRHTKLCA